MNVTSTTRQRVVSDRPAQNAFQAITTGTHGRIEIYGDIYPADWGGIDETTIAEALNAMPDVKTLEIRVNSGGGDVYIGWAIRNRIEQHPAAKTVHIDGIAASSAATIAMTLGGLIVMPTLSQVMFHESMTFVFGNKSDITKRLAQLAQIDAACVKALAEITGNPESDFAPWFADGAETWLSADDAIDAGFNVVKQGTLEVKTSQQATERPRLVQFSKAPATAVALLATIPDGVNPMTKPTETKPAIPATPASDPPTPATQTTTAPAPSQPTSSTATESTPAPSAGAGVSLTAPQVVTMTKDDLTALVTGAVTTAVTSALAAQTKASETEDIRATCQLAGCTAEQTQSYVDRKFTLAEVRQQLATQLNGKEKPPVQGTGAGDAFAKYREAYEADRPRFEQAGISVEQFVKRRCQDDGVTPPAETK